MARISPVIRQRIQSFRPIFVKISLFRPNETGPRIKEAMSRRYAAMITAGAIDNLINVAALDAANMPTKSTKYGTAFPVRGDCSELREDRWRSVLPHVAMPVVESFNCEVFLSRGLPCGAKAGPAFSLARPRAARQVCHEASMPLGVRQRQ